MPVSNGSTPQGGPRAVLTISEADEGLTVTAEFDPPWNNQDEDANPVTHWAAMSAVQHIERMAASANLQVDQEDEDDG